MKRLILPALTCMTAPALAAPHTDLAAIDRAVEAFTGMPIGAPGGAAMPVDRRLRLAGCQVPLALSWHGTRRDSVLVQCPDAGGWRLYVPIAAAGAGGAAEAPAISRGDAITVAVTGAGFAVSQPGEAMDSGAVGAWIRVRAVSTGSGAARAQPMRAQVIRPGLVGIPLP